ncbi:hypothetical protein FNV43_RR15060 [Rhamnella rubrinervis]|uniref:Uncharacterized protein n=1 Tax=Rhamnella rubrinervis TaxID=2594499 RepID=A0A8K0E7Z7_9ROSA|nr:hypothetical protein FNV43_RR15060 [Rhamnella rubrinervis]
MDPEVLLHLIQFLKDHRSTFTWSTDDMVGIDSGVISHKLNVDPTYKTMKKSRTKCWLKFIRGIAVIIREDPYQVIGIPRPRAYHLQALNGMTVRKVNYLSQLVLVLICSFIPDGVHYIHEGISGRGGCLLSLGVLLELFLIRGNFALLAALIFARLGGGPINLPGLEPSNHLPFGFKEGVLDPLR